MSKVTVNELSEMADKTPAWVRDKLAAAHVDSDGEQKAASKDGRGRPAKLYPLVAAKKACGIG